jgi:Tfp pilus assembly protein PilV
MKLGQKGQSLIEALLGILILTTLFLGFASVTKRCYLRRSEENNKSLAARHALNNSHSTRNFWNPTHDKRFYLEH